MNIKITREHKTNFSIITIMIVRSATLQNYNSNNINTYSSQ